MANSAEAIELIRDHVSRSPIKLRLGQVLNLKEDDPARDEIAGRGIDRVTEVAVTKLRHGENMNKVFPDGVLTGTLACRAVLLEPGVSERFVGSRTEGALHLRTRLTYEEPSIKSLPRGTALTVGGTVTQVAVHNLMPDDGESLDDYYDRLAAYEASLRNGGGEDAGQGPQMPAIRAMYGLSTPGEPNFDKGQTFRPRADERFQLRRMGFTALQEEYPAARVLSINNQGYISETELMDWAVALTGEAA